MTAPNTLQLRLLEGDHIRDRNILNTALDANYYRRWNESDGSLGAGVAGTVTDNGTGKIRITPTVGLSPADDTIIVFGICPAGLTVGTRYYVVNAAPTFFAVSLTQGGSPVAWEADGACTYYLLTSILTVYAYNDTDDTFAIDTTLIYDRSKYVLVSTHDCQYADPYAIQYAETTVDALIRTIELIQEQSYVRSIAGYAVFAKFGICKTGEWTWNAGTSTGTLVEVMAKFYKYQMACNVSDFTSGYATEFAMYLMPEDVNDAPATASIVKKRNFIVPAKACSTEMSESISVEYRLTSEGRIYDFVLVTTPRMDMMK